MTLRGYYIKEIRENRGKPRIWLEGKQLERAGLTPGASYEVITKGGSLVLKADPNGSRTVTTKERHGKPLPIIDLNSKELLGIFEGMDAVRLAVRQGEVYLLPLASELKRKRRLKRIRSRVNEGEPLEIGSTSHGLGVLGHAVHQGLNNAGLPARTAFANDIRADLMEQADRVHPSWDDRTIPFVAPMQELAFDESGTRHIPEVDIFEAGIPCSGASVAGRAKRGLVHPEAHPEVGHLVVGALVLIAKANPAIVLIENVTQYATSASADILRNQLRDLGYDCHEREFNGADFNALEHRKRWVLCAVTKGMAFDWDWVQLPEKRDMRLSDVLEDIPLDSPMWSEMRGLKDKQERDKAAGKSFAMQIFTGDSTKIGTLTKGLAKNRSTDPKIQHSENPDLLRNPTPLEHARVKQAPPGLIEGLSATLAHEALGQSVVHDQFVAIAEGPMARSILDFAQTIDSDEVDLKQITSAMSEHITDVASEIVSEIRRALPRVTYEGPITMNDLGMVIQDIGNGMGILHRLDRLSEDPLLGARVQIRYDSMSGPAQVIDLDAATRPVPTPPPQPIPVADIQFEF
ncbi:DNA cytosine methyltransferase [Geopseudomonas aromaticivorans]